MNKESKLLISKNLLRAQTDSKKEEPQSKEKYDDVRAFLSEISSGVSYRNDPDCFASSAGSIITTIPKLKKMVEDKYNIIKAEFIGEVNGDILVSVDFERLELLENERPKSR